MLHDDKGRSSVARRRLPASGQDPGERAFLERYDASRYPHPSVAVDVILLTVREGALWSVLVRREAYPQRGRWSLPGGFVGIREGLDQAAARVLREKTGLAGVFLEQLYTFGDPDRDPRTRVISVAYFALVSSGGLARAARAGRAGLRGEGQRLCRIEVPWEGEGGGPVRAWDGAGRLALAFDHAAILGAAVKRIRGKLDYSTIGFQLLPDAFTLLELQRVHETVLGRPLNKDSFRRRLLASGQLAATGASEQDVDHRPAELYRLVRRPAP
jgi:8-oxo-dGTP diphosphatase